MSLSVKEIEQLALLSRLQLADELATQLGTNLARMMEQVATVQEVDTAGVDLNVSFAATAEKMRADVAIAPATNLATAAAAQQDGFVVVPKVIP